MPVVPRYESSVQESALPGVQLNPNASLEAFGGGQSANAVGNVAQDIVAKYQKQADDIAVNEAYGNSLKAYSDTVNQTQTEKGKNAIGSTDRAMEELSSRIKEITKGMSRSQTAQFYPAQQRLMARIYAQTNQYEFQEHFKYDTETLETGIEASIDMARNSYSEEGVVSEEIEKQAQDIRDYAERNGYDKGWASKRIGMATSQTYSTVVAELLNNGEYEEADELYKHVSKSLLPDDKSKLEKGIKEGRIRLQVAEETDVALQEISEYEAMKVVNKIKNEEVKKRTKAIVKDHFDTIKKAESEDVDRIFMQGFGAIQEDPTLTAKDVLSPMDYAVLVDNNPILIQTLDRMSRSDEGEYTAYTAFIDLDAQKIADMSNADFYTYYASMPQEQRQTAINIREAAQENVSKAKRYLTPAKIVTQAMDKNNMKSDEDGQRFQMQIDDFVRDYSTENGGRWPSKELMQAEMDRLLIDVSVRRSWWADGEKKLYQFDDEQIENAYIPFDDDAITPELIKSFESQTNDKITNDEIERAAFFQLHGQPAALKQFLKTIRDR